MQVGTNQSNEDKNELHDFNSAEINSVPFSKPN